MDNRTEICRLCMLNGGKSMESIFCKTNTSCIADTIASVTQLTLFEGDGLPVAVCQKCLFQLETAHSFIQRCTSSDKFLRSLHLAGVEVHPIFDLHQMPSSADNSAVKGGVEILPIRSNAVSNNKFAIKEEVMDDVEFEEAENARLTYIIGDDYEDDNITIKMEGFSNPIPTSTEEVPESGSESSTEPGEDDDDEDYMPKKCHSRVKLEPRTPAYDITTRSIHLIAEQNDQTEYKCHLCPQRFYDKKDLKNHLTNFSDKHPYQCEQYGEPTMSRLTGNKAAYTSPKAHRYKCGEAKCDLTFALKKALSQHERRHLAARKHKCGQCDKSFQQLILLRNHALIHK